MECLAMPTTPCDSASAGDSFALPPRISVAPQSAATRELRASPSSSSDGASPRSDSDTKHGLSKRAAPRMWTEEEHALFLHGLELGYRGRWAKLASEILHGGRTPAQVASHAQKYFLKLEASRGKKARVAAAPEPALFIAAQMLAAEELEAAACCGRDAAPACSSDSAGASCRPETPPRVSGGGCAVPAHATSLAPALPPAATPALPLAATPALLPAVPLTRMLAEAFAEQLQRSLLGGVTMTRDECTVVATLETLLQRSHAPLPQSRKRRLA